MTDASTTDTPCFAPVEGREHRARIVREERTHADSDLAAHLELAPGSEIFRVTLVHLADELPIQLEDRWVNPAAAADFLDLDFATTTPTEYLLGTIDPEEMEHVVQAIMPDDATAALLAIAPTEPCLRLARRTWNNGRVVTFAVLTYPSSRYDLSARYRISPGRLPRLGPETPRVEPAEPTRNRR